MERIITIAGGGLAGLCLGIALRLRGGAVVLHEAGSYPRHRVCGEFISGVSRATLDSLGIADLFENAKRHRSTEWFVSDRRILAAPLPEGLGISRFTLDRRLSHRFRELGGVLLEHSRVAARPEEGLVWCGGRKPARGEWIGLKCHVSALATGADLEMHLGSNGYVGLAKVEETKVNVCGLFRVNPKLKGKGTQTLENYLKTGGLERLVDRIFSAEVDADSFIGVAGFRLGAQPISEGLASLGDAWGMIPPFTGNGMSMAFEAAASAAEPLRRWQTAQITWENALVCIRHRLARRFARRMLWARILHPFLTAPAGQTLFSLVSRSGMLPFKSCFRALR